MFDAVIYRLVDSPLARCFEVLIFCSITAVCISINPNFDWSAQGYITEFVNVVVLYIQSTTLKRVQLNNSPLEYSQLTLIYYRSLYLSPFSYCHHNPPSVHLHVVASRKENISYKSQSGGASIEPLNNTYTSESRGN